MACAGQGPHFPLDTAGPHLSVSCPELVSPLGLPLPMHAAGVVLLSLWSSPAEHGSLHGHPPPPVSSCHLQPAPLVRLPPWPLVKSSSRCPGLTGPDSDPPEPSVLPRERSVPAKKPVTRPPPPAIPGATPAYPAQIVSAQSSRKAWLMGLYRPEPSAKSRVLSWGLITSLMQTFNS